MATVSELLARADTLPSDDPRRDGEVLLCEALQKPRTYLIAWPDAEVSDDLESRYDDLLARRMSGEPIAYILGRREFWSLEFEANADTLIPRPETEVLVEQVLQRVAEPEARALDLGTGSGAIAVALGSERPLWSILATDASEAALAVAARNAERLAKGNVRFVAGSWYSPVGDQRFHVIASNPPYVAEGDEHLSKGDLPFEPASALSSGDDGLDAIREIVEGAPAHLLAGGWLFLEHGYDQGSSVRELLVSQGFAEVETVADLAGVDRVSLGLWKDGEA